MTKKKILFILIIFLVIGALSLLSLLSFDDTEVLIKEIEFKDSNIVF